jgi:hypothetical protein
MSVDVFWAGILGLHVIAVFGTVAGMIRESGDPCPACRHPEHPMLCQACGCDFMTDPE